MSRHDDKSAVLMNERLKELAAYFEKNADGSRKDHAVPFNKREFHNTTIRMFLTPDGKGKHGDMRYTRPTIDQRTGKERYDGKGVFVARAHLNGVNGATYGEAGTFEMPLSAALIYGLIRGREAYSEPKGAHAK